MSITERKQGSSIASLSHSEVASLFMSDRVDQIARLNQIQEAAQKQITEIQRQLQALQEQNLGLQEHLQRSESSEKSLDDEDRRCVEAHTLRVTQTRLTISNIRASIEGLRTSSRTMYINAKANVEQLDKYMVGAPGFVPGSIVRKWVSEHGNNGEI